jgi:hypothetical protein
LFLFLQLENLFDALTQTTLWEIYLVNHSLPSPNIF